MDTKPRFIIPIISTVLVITIAIASIILIRMSAKEKAKHPVVSKTPVIPTAQDGTDLKEKYKSSEEAVKAEVSKIKYDLISVIDSARETSISSVYKLEKFVTITKNVVDDKDKKGGEKQNKEPEDTEPIKDYLKQTKTAKSDYEDFAMAFYPKKAYIVGMLKPMSGKEIAIEQAIRNFIADTVENTENTELRSTYQNYKMVSHNGYYIIVVAPDSENLKNKIIENAERVDQLIKQAVQEGYEDASK